MVDFTKKKSLKVELERLEQEESEKQRWATRLLLAEFALPVSVVILSSISLNLLWWGILCFLFLLGFLGIFAFARKTDRQKFFRLRAMALLFNAGFWIIYLVFIIFRIVFKI
ncbi:hypothetical protein [Lactovum odontotermitis]